MSLIAVVQLCSTDDVEHNLSVIEKLAVEASAAGAKAMFLPECCTLMQTSRAQLRETAEVFRDGPIQRRLSKLAATTGLLLFAGSLPLQSDDPKRVFNTSLVFDKSGELITRYDKVHLFDVTLDSGEQYHESAYTMAGDNLVNLDCPIGNVGLSVCYDLRFPELYRVLVARGAQILLVPSAFSITTGPAHWTPLLQARAIENFCYVIAAAQHGTHPSGRKTWGHSVVIDPWGRVIAEKGQGVGLLMAEIDLKQVDRVRKQLPSLNHRTR